MLTTVRPVEWLLLMIITCLEFSGTMSIRSGLKSYVLTTPPFLLEILFLICCSCSFKDKMITKVFCEDWPIQWPYQQDRDYYGMWSNTHTDTHIQHKEEIINCRCLTMKVKISIATHCQPLVNDWLRKLNIGPINIGGVCSAMWSSVIVCTSCSTVHVV